MKILCLSHLTYDITLPMEEYPIENNKYHLNNPIESGGGAVVNATVLLAKWGLQYETYLGGVIGNDNYGNVVKKEINSFGLSTRFIETTYDQATSVSFIMINKQNGSRTIINIEKSYVPLKKLNLDFVPDLIFTDAYDFKNSLELLEKFPNSISVVDANNFNDETIDVCKKSNYILAASDFAEKLVKENFDYENNQSLVDIYTKIAERFNKAIVIITLGEHGVLYSVDNNIRLMPALNLDVKDTSGAGDIFHGAFVYGLNNNFDLEKCIKFANIAAGLSCAKENIRSSIPELTEVTKYYEEH